MRTADQHCYLIINRIGIFGGYRESINYCTRITELIKADVCLPSRRMLSVMAYCNVHKDIIEEHLRSVLIMNLDLLKFNRGTYRFCDNNWIS
jgi:hypothetical protein